MLFSKRNENFSFNICFVMINKICTMKIQAFAGCLLPKIRTIWFGHLISFSVNQDEAIPKYPKVVKYLNKRTCDKNYFILKWTHVVFSDLSFSMFHYWRLNVNCIVWQRNSSFYDICMLDEFIVKHLSWFRDLWNVRYHG